MVAKADGWKRGIIYQSIRAGSGTQTMQTVTAAIFLAIAGSLVWAGFNRVARIREKAAAQMDIQVNAVNRNTEAIERVAAALEARNQARSLEAEASQTRPLPKSN
jgi:hypothetical protein